MGSLNKMLALVFVGGLILGSVGAKNIGSIQVEGYGEVFICVGDGNQQFITVHDNGFTLSGGGGLHFCATAADDFSDKNMFWKTPLMDKHFSYTLDLSNVPCHCNAAGYFSQMPADSIGEWGQWYCDANFVNGQWCPEYDTLESNKYQVAGTLHTCNGGPGYWGDCDRGGCQNNAFRADSNMLCPEDRCTINTNRPFTISHSQSTGYANIWMSQDGREASFNICEDYGYNANMAASYNEMVFTASLWGGGGIDMNWLDGMTGCQGDCNLASASVTFSDFAIW